MKARPNYNAVIRFRCLETMHDAVVAHQAARKLPEFPDAARELMQAGIGAGELGQLAAELRALGGDPHAALRTALAEIEKQTCTAPLCAGAQPR